MNPLFTILLVLLVPLAFVAVLMTVEVFKNGNPDARLNHLWYVTPEQANEIAVGAGCAEIFQSNGFVFESAHKFGMVVVYSWRQTTPSDVTRWFSIQHTPQMHCIDITTGFDAEGTCSLTTANAKVAFTFPRQPGAFMQSILFRPFFEVWQRHLEAEAYLRGHFNLPISRSTVSWRDDNLRAIKAQMAYIRSLPLWFLRGPWWYFVTRNLRNNVSIEEQHRRGWLPKAGALMRLA